MTLNDEQVQARIDELEQGPEQVAADAERLEAIRVELDRLWDYLRQRRALRDAGADPDGAQMRDEETVKKYLG